ncbi:hypothetical protein EJB05_40999, partial [Eragrostis curvula]
MSPFECVLLHADAFRGNFLDLNATTAHAHTHRDFHIEVSLSCPERPLLPTILFANIPGIDFINNPPRIVRAVEDLILLCVPEVGFDDKYNYFIYRPGGEKGPSLKLIPRPPQAFYDADVGLLRRGEEHYTVAALLTSSKHGVYDLHRFNSVTEEWTMDEVPLVEPQSIRGIAFIDNPPCLKFVHLGVNAVPIIHQNDDSDDDDDYEDEEWEIRDWTITTWSNTKMTTSWEDWNMDCEVKASRTSVSSNLNSKLLKCGLLSTGGADQPERAFQNLLVTFPAPGITDDGVVYLQARLKFRAPKVFVLALDTRANKLLGAVEFSTERVRGSGTGVVYFPSNIGKYIDPKARIFPVPKGDEDDYDWEESSQYEGTESLKLSSPSLVLQRLANRLARSVLSCGKKGGPSLREGDQPE